MDVFFGIVWNIGNVPGPGTFGFGLLKNAKISPAEFAEKSSIKNDQNAFAIAGSAPPAPVVLDTSRLIGTLELTSVSVPATDVGLLRSPFYWRNSVSEPDMVVLFPSFRMISAKICLFCGRPAGYRRFIFSTELTPNIHSFMQNSDDFDSVRIN
jgi:hypothetical protein